jgi:hypothetical protein
VPTRGPPVITIAFAINAKRIAAYVVGGHAET